ncbi:FecR family protein [Arcticibacter pallidicorallinus]|uniref:FecR family protein n=1 Tax=Arcticibacter pallidicorallinus TaxID=1259464 RepID=A0A2T0TU82_9SPHI|nr:FecR family protein [Arcticibacter pallidicorallinus]PRY49211.1 FecR family protein [Arcticibacter pallidicorallinus]
MLNKEIVLVFKKFINDSCDAEEQDRVFSYLQNGEFLDEWNRAISEEADKSIDVNVLSALSSQHKDELENKILKKISKRSIPYWIRYSAAAIVLLALGISLSTFEKDQPTQEPAETLAANVEPGRNVASLTLADGTVINLDDKGAGKLSTQGNVSIIKKGDGEIVYQPIDDVKPVTANNSLATPRGGQYQITLPDGTHAWLNSASSIEYPTSFGPKERRVRIKGEVYFEVSHNKNKPFIAETDGQEIQVLGTHFNVNAYKDEGAIKTTLLEGSVKIAISSTKSLVLKPGQQSSVMPGRDQINVKRVDTEAATGWKNGDIHFNSADLKGVLRQLARWYDVDVDMTRVPAVKINGVISRNVSLAVVLKAIEATSDVHLAIENKPNGEGRRIIMK